jgi:hypothetical protein
VALARTRAASHLGTRVFPRYVPGERTTDGKTAGGRLARDVRVRTLDA